MRLLGRLRCDLKARASVAAIAATLILAPAAVLAQDGDPLQKARAEAERTQAMPSMPKFGGPDNGGLAAQQTGEAQPGTTAKAETARNAKKKNAQNEDARTKAPAKNKQGKKKTGDGTAPTGAAGKAKVPAESAAEKARADLIGGVALRDLTVTRERPLFTPSRQKPKPPPPKKKVEKPPAPPPPPPPPPQPPSLRLVGVVMSDDSTIALMLANDKSVVRLAMGDQVDGWAVVKLEPDNVELQYEDQRRVYRMFKDETAGAGGGPLGGESRDLGRNANKNNNKKKKKKN